MALMIHFSQRFVRGIRRVRDHRVFSRAGDVSLREKSLPTVLARMLNRFILKLVRLAQEPPFRLAVKQCLRVYSASIRTKAAWDAVDRPHYLTGMLAAADQAFLEGISEISVIEFGVGSGEGLLVLEKYAIAVEQETRVRIAVYGFDTGKGLPKTHGEYRDHPDYWKGGDHPMDEEALRQGLTSRTELLIGDVVDTVPQFVNAIQSSPIGFIAFDLDLYSSTREALRIFLLPGRRLLRRVMIYFDDIDLAVNHKFAGVLLAIDEFNEASNITKIDRWRGLANHRAFFESPWLKKMYMAHDLEAISRVKLFGSPAHVRPSHMRG